MTNEEAKKIIYNQWQAFLEDNIDYAGISEAYKMAMKALEQQPILDKIRAEIEQITDTMGVSYNQYVSKIDVLKIIEKYKAESEDKE